MKKIFFLISVCFFFLSSSGNVIERLPWSDIVCNKNVQSIYLCTFKRRLTDSTTLCNVLKSSNKELKDLIVNKNIIRKKPTEFWIVIIYTDGHQYISWAGERKGAYQLFSKTMEIKKINAQTNIDEKIKAYRKWLIALCESKNTVLRREGFIEWEWRGGFIAHEYVCKRFAGSNVTGDALWEKIITQKIKKRVMNVLLNIKYPHYAEWVIMLDDFAIENKDKFKKYSYDFLQRYAANFEKNSEKIQTNEIQEWGAFYILAKVETDENILKIVREYNNDNSIYEPHQEKYVLEKYIIPILKIYQK